MKTDYTLYYAPDNASLVIRLALEEFELSYKTALVNRRINEQQSATYKTLAPTGLIPALKTPDGVLFETAAILLWLQDRHGNSNVQINSKTRGAFLSWLFFMSNTLHADLRQLFYPQNFVQSNLLEFHNKTAARVAQHLALIEQQLIRQVSDLSMLLNGIHARPVLMCYLACMWRWTQLYPSANDLIEHPQRPIAQSYPKLMAMLSDFENRQSAQKAKLSEGLGEYPFTVPSYPIPPEGYAT